MLFRLFIRLFIRLIFIRLFTRLSIIQRTRYAHSQVIEAAESDGSKYEVTGFQGLVGTVTVLQVEQRLVATTISWNNGAVWIRIE